jgi:hypothetical protein
MISYKEKKIKPRSHLNIILLLIKAGITEGFAGYDVKFLRRLKVEGIFKPT